MGKIDQTPKYDVLISVM